MNDIVLISIPETTIKNIVEQAIRKVLNEQQPIDKPKEETAYITKKQAATMAAVSVSTINNWRRAGHIKYKKFGNVARINKSDFIDYLENK